MELYNPYAMWIGTRGNIYIGNPELTHNLLYQNGNWSIRANGGDIVFYYGNGQFIEMSDIVSRLVTLEQKVNSGGNNTTPPNNDNYSYNIKDETPVLHEIYKNGEYVGDELHTNDEGADGTKCSKCGAVKGKDFD